MWVPTLEEMEVLERALPRMSMEERADLSRMLSHVPPKPKPIPFREFIEHAKPDYKFWPYNERLIERLQDVADGKIRRLMVFMPPRMGKTETTSKLFPAYNLYRFPERKVGIVSYVEDRAYESSTAARDYLAQARHSLQNGLKQKGLKAKRDESAVRQFFTAHGGEMWAAGIGGSLTGLGFHLGVLDDPIKNSQEAKSPTIRQRNKDWYPSTFASRAEPNASIIIVNTRWHPDDVSGWLLRRESEHPEDAEGWHVILFDMEKSDEPLELPPTCTIEPDPREVGELLNPARFPENVVRKMKRGAGPYVWSALYQQRPRAREGALFKYSWVNSPSRPLAEAMPTNVVRAVRYWDIAGTPVKEGESHNPDWTVGVLLLQTMDEMIWVADMVRFRASVAERDMRMRQVIERDANSGLPVEWRIEREAGIDADDRTRNLAKALAPYPFSWQKHLQGGKEDRFEGFAAQAEVGNVRVVKGPWNGDWFEELTGFPFGDHDDIVDSTSGGFHVLFGDKGVFSPVKTRFY